MDLRKISRITIKTINITLHRTKLELNIKSKFEQQHKKKGQKVTRIWTKGDTNMVKNRCPLSLPYIV